MRPRLGRYDADVNIDMVLQNVPSRRQDLITFTCPATSGPLPGKLDSLRNDRLPQLLQ